MQRTAASGRSRRFGIRFGLLLVGYFIAASAGAATLTPNIATDPPSANDGDCSLREAVLQATTNVVVDAGCGAAGDAAATDVIVLTDTENYGLTISGLDDTGAAGDLDVDDDSAALDLRLQVAGGGSATITQNAALDDRVLHVLGGAAVEVVGVTFTGGLVLGAPGGPGGGNGGPAEGGGIFNAGTLTMSDCSVSGNAVAGGPALPALEDGGSFAGGPARGGGVFNAGTLTMTDCTVLSNSASGGAGAPAEDIGGQGGTAQGGGIRNAAGATLHLTLVMVAENTVSGGPGGPGTGGIPDIGGPGGIVDGAGVSNSGSASIIDSEIALNNAGGGPGGGGENGGIGGSAFGAGVRNLGGGSLTLTGSTIAGNDATGGVGAPGDSAGGNGGAAFGGGLRAEVGVTLANVTISGNTASGGPGGGAPGSSGLAQGGGYSQGGGTTSLDSVTLTDSTPNGVAAFIGTVTFRNSIVALQAGGGQDCIPSIAIVSADFNLESGTTCGFTEANDQQNVAAPQLDLGPLASNGGPTPTHAIGPASFALNQGSTVLLFDQRGFGRPQGPADDVGAFERLELSSADLAVTKTDSPDPVVPGATITYTITLTNLGPSAAGLVSVSDTVPASTTFVSFTASPGWTTATPPPGGTGLVVANLPSFPPGPPAVFTLVVQVDPGVAAGTTITNTATAGSDSIEIDVTNNSDIETTLVGASALLAIPTLSPAGAAILLAALAAAGLLLLHRR